MTSKKYNKTRGIQQVGPTGEVGECIHFFLSTNINKQTTKRMCICGNQSVVNSASRYKKEMYLLECAVLGSRPRCQLKFVNRVSQLVQGNSGDATASSSVVQDQSTKKVKM